MMTGSGPHVVDLHKDGVSRGGSHGTMLFGEGELNDVVDSPSADVEGDVDRAALLGIKPPFLDQRFVLKRGKTMLGRHEGNDIVLPEKSISARHAWILDDDDDGRCRLMNILSTNGTFVNDLKVHEAVLVDGDRVRFGRAEFVFRAGTGTREKETAQGSSAWVWGGALSVVAAAVAAALYF